MPAFDLEPEPRRRPHPRDRQGPRPARHGRTSSRPRGDYIDIVKLGWGTAYVTHNLARKLDVLRSRRQAGRARRHVLRGRLRPRPARRVQALARRARPRPTSRSPTARVEIPRERKLELIADFARDFTVLSEVGSKDSEVVFAPYEWVRVDQGGARRRRLEGRSPRAARAAPPASSGRPARCAPGLVDEIAHEVDFARPRSSRRRRSRARPGSSSTSART